MSHPAEHPVARIIPIAMDNTQQARMLLDGYVYPGKDDESEVRITVPADATWRDCAAIAKEHGLFLSQDYQIFQPEGLGFWSVDFGRVALDDGQFVWVVAENGEIVDWRQLGKGAWIRG